VERIIAVTRRMARGQRSLVPAGIHADPRWLHQVITNLLTNALKFTPAGGLVTIAAGPSGADAVLTVTDTVSEPGARKEPDRALPQQDHRRRQRHLTREWSSPRGSGSVTPWSWPLAGIRRACGSGR
jgi:Histidine kinase-, DNA gyrase B-, and HSP90-like ATPase